MFQFLQIFHLTFTIYDLLKNLKHTFRTDTARSAFTAGFSLSKAHEESCNLYHTGMFVHNYQTTGTNDRSVFLDRVKVKRYIQMFFCQTSAGRTTNLNSLECSAGFQSSTDIENNLS